MVDGDGGNRAVHDAVMQFIAIDPQCAFCNPLHSLVYSVGKRVSSTLPAHHTSMVFT
jgi:hypothetical protein